MSFESFIALKYLVKGKRHGFVSLISLISVLGIAVGVMALIVVLAVMSGFSRELKNKIVGVQPHIIVEQFSGMRNPREAVALVRSMNIPELESVAPFVHGQGIIRSETAATGVAVKGIDPADEPLDLFRDRMVSGTLSFDDVVAQDDDNQSVRVGRILIGAELARRLGVGLGEVVYVISPALDELDFKASSLKKVIKQTKNEPFVVSGIFRIGMNDFDNNLGLMNLKQAQNLYRLEQDQVTGLSIRLTDVDLADRLKDEVRTAFGPGFQVRSWADLNRTFFAALKVEKTVMTILLSLIILVAVFNIVSSLIMVVMEKTRDIGILRALGATKGSVRDIFLLQGFLIGFSGIVLGTVSGLLLAFHLNPVADFLERTFGLVVFPPDIYLFDQIPAEINMPDVAVIVGFALVMSILAAAYPANRAANLLPIQALRYE